MVPDDLLIRLENTLSGLVHPAHMDLVFHLGLGKAFVDVSAVLQLLPGLQLGFFLRIRINRDFHIRLLLRFLRLGLLLKWKRKSEFLLLRLFIRSFVLGLVSSFGSCAQFCARSIGNF